MKAALRNDDDDDDNNNNNNNNNRPLKKRYRRINIIRDKNQDGLHKNKARTALKYLRRRDIAEHVHRKNESTKIIHTFNEY